jgi:hypothetical protein
MTICHIPRPVLTAKARCHHALHFDGATEQRIYDYCHFQKADDTKYRFLFISPNKYAYFLPETGVLYTVCPGKSGSQNATKIDRSGVFSYPPRCYASINDYMFYDTAVEAIPQRYVPQKDIGSFLQIARGSWPALNPSISDSDNLLIAANDNTYSEPMAALGTRARILATIKEIHHLDKAQADTKAFYNQLWYYVSCITVFVTTNALTGLWYCCCRQLPVQRHFRLPKFGKTDTDPEAQTHTADTILMQETNTTTDESRGLYSIRSGRREPYPIYRKDSANISRKTTAIVTEPHSEFSLMEHTREIDNFERSTLPRTVQF